MVYSNDELRDARYPRQQPKSGGYRSPRTRLKLYGSFAGFNCALSAYTAIAGYGGPAGLWTGLAVAGASGVIAVLIWVIALAARPSRELIWAALGAVVVRTLIAVATLQGSPQAMLITVFFAGLIIYILNQTFTRLRAEVEAAA